MEITLAGKKIKTIDGLRDYLNKAMKKLEMDFAPIDDMRASKSYRMEIAKNLLIKCFLEIKNRKSIRLS